MIITPSFLCILSVITYTESECFPTSYYRNCWIRGFPGLQVDLDESEREGARVLQKYHGYCAQNCSRTCCLTPNFSCNLAVFHYNTTQENDNCFHLHCPTLQSCIFRQKVNAIIYKVTKGVDPDLLVFGKYITTNAQVLPYQTVSRLNTSEPSISDKRQFNRPHMATSSSMQPTRPDSTPQPSSTLNTISQSISTISHADSTATTQDIQDTIPASLVQRSTTLKKTAQPNSSVSPDHITTFNMKWTSAATQNFTQVPSMYNPQASLVSQDKPTITASVTVSEVSKETTSGLKLTSKSELNTTRAPRTVHSVQTMPTSYTVISTISSSKVTTTTTTPVSFRNTQQSSRNMATANTILGTNYPYLSKPTPTSIPFIAVTTMTQEVTTQKPKVVTRRNTSSSWSQTQPNNSHIPTSTVLETGIKQSSTQNTNPQLETNVSANTNENSTNSFSDTTSTGHHSSPTALLTDLGMNISPTPPAIVEESQPFPNDSKGYIIHNVTTVNDPQPGGEGELTQVWHLAANTVLVAMATCATLLCGCCSLLMAMNWRGRRRRKGRYQTTLRGKKGSMRLIKYVIVRERS